jgi:hypothetical protein
MKAIPTTAPLVAPVKAFFLSPLLMRILLVRRPIFGVGGGYVKRVLVRCDGEVAGGVQLVCDESCLLVMCEMVFECGIE